MTCTTSLAYGTNLLSVTCRYATAAALVRLLRFCFQVEMLLTLQRLMEHFAAAAFSIQQTRSFDAVCVCVPGCIAAIADSLMRRCATDYVSQVPYLQLPALLWLRIHLAGLLASNGPDTRRQTAGCGWLWSQCWNFRRTD